MRINPVLFALLTIVSLSCSKSKTAPAPQARHPDISKMAGNHLWSGITVNDVVDTAVYQSHLDTSAYSFSADIVIENDSTIYFRNQPSSQQSLALYYGSTNTINSTISFIGYFSDKYGDYQLDSIVYNYATNSIVWGERMNTGGYKPYSLAGSFLVHTP